MFGHEAGQIEEISEVKGYRVSCVGCAEVRRLGAMGRTQAQAELCAAGWVFVPKSGRWRCAVCEAAVARAAAEKAAKRAEKAAKRAAKAEAKKAAAVVTPPAPPQAGGNVEGEEGQGLGESDGSAGTTMTTGLEDTGSVATGDAAAPQAEETEEV